MKQYKFIINYSTSTAELFYLLSDERFKILPKYDKYSSSTQEIWQDAYIKYIHISDNIKKVIEKC